MFPESVQAYIRKHRPHLAYLLIAVCIVLVSYSAWIHAGTPGTDDLSNLNIPQRQFLAASYRHGLWPLWNPLSFGGQPFLAAGQAGPLYLPNLVYVVLPIVTAVKVSYILHELLLTVGAYLSAWHFSKSRLGALVGAVTFADCGFFVGHQIHTQMFDAACWLPLVVYLFARLFEQPGRRLLTACALSLGGEIFAGHPQMTFYLCLFLVLYLLLMFAWRPTRIRARNLLLCVIPLVGGFAVAAAQLLPTLQLVSYSDRSAAPASFLLAGSMPPVGLAQLMMPFLAGGGYTETAASLQQYVQHFGWYTFWEFTCYTGIVSLLLAVAAVLAKFVQHLYVRTLAIIGCFALLLSLGLNTKAALVLVQLPGFDLFRVPARYISLVDFCTAMLAAIAIGALQTDEVQLRIRTAVITTAAIALPGILSIRVFSAAASAPRAAFIVPLCMAVLVMLLCVWNTASLGKRLPAILAAFAVVDIGFYASSASTFVSWERGGYSAPSSVDTWLASHAGDRAWPRIVSFGNTSVQLDRNLSFLVASLNGYDSIVPKWYADEVGLTRTDVPFITEPRSLADALGVRFAVTTNHVTLPFPSKTNGIQTWQMTLPDLNAADRTLRINLALNHSILPSPGAIFSVSLRSGTRALTQLVNGWPASAYLIPIPKNWPHYQPTTIQINNEAWNGWYMLKNLQVEQSSTVQTIPIGQTFAPKAWTRVQSDARETVWRNPDPIQRAWFADDKTAPLVQSRGRATYTGGTENRQTWTVQTGHAAYIVLSQMYDPNWTAAIDGKSASVEQVDGVLTAIRVPAGSHKLILTYNPLTFRLGLATSILSTLILFTLWMPGGVRINRRFRAKHRASQSH